MLVQALVCSTLAAFATATNLFVSSYAGNITTLSLTEQGGNYSLEKIFYNSGCLPNPSWLTLDHDRGTLYCLDEGLTVANGSLSSYTINTDGSLTQVQKAETISGPVAGAIYGPAAGQRAIVLAHYTGSAVSDWQLSSNDSGVFTFNQAIPFTLAQPGPNPARQDVPHEHEAIIDPTGQYILTPDLGADLVRVYSFNSTTDILTPLDPLHVVPGSGPRHAVFYNPYGVACDTCTTFLFVVTELGNTVTSYAVKYEDNYGGLSFTQVYNSTTYGDLPLPSGNAAAEIALTPDNRYVVISNRNNTSFNLTNPDPTNSTLIPSDSLSTFEVMKNGTLKFLQLSPAGGSYPRQISLNAVGDLVAVGLQYSSEVVIMARDVLTGLIGDMVASVEVDGQVTCVRWDEQTRDGTGANP